MAMPVKFMLSAAVILAISGCGGAKIKNQKKIVAFPEQRQSLALIGDDNLSVSLDWVLVRNSPESWAKNADWDEYIFRIQSLPGHLIEVTDIVVYDSLGTRLTHLEDRSDLKRASKQTIHRYKDVNLSIKPGAGAGTVATGATGAVLGAAYVSGVTAGSGLMGLAGATAAAGTMVLLTPVFIFAGVLRGVHHHQVTNEIHRIAVVFPLQVDDKTSKEVHVFYPFAPSPNHVEITYSDNQGSHKLNIDTKHVLAGLHMAKTVK